MKYLLDTHILLWYAAGDPKLPPRIVKAIDTDRTNCHVSIATLWEISIKQAAGKLDLGMSIEQFTAIAVDANRFAHMPIAVRHLGQLAQLPMHHRDPFDRILIAQAVADEMSIISADGVFSNYGIQRTW